MLDVAERAKAIVVEQLVADPDHVIDNANFIDDLGADSLDLVELAIKFEQADFLRAEKVGRDFAHTIDGVLLAPALSEPFARR